jgi:uncharacterized membrane protein
MTDFVVPAAIYLHVIALALWFGGLFGYVFMVWPAIMRHADGSFPRDLLVTIAIRTAPWIYLAMACVVASFLLVWRMGGGAISAPWMVVYGLLLTGLVANNLYGTLVAWPRIMWLDEPDAVRTWFWFRVRMTVALAIGLVLFSVAAVTT